MSMASSNISEAIKSHLINRSLHPTESWLNALLQTLKSTQPLPALKATALHRLLATDITTSLQPLPSSVFPADIHDGIIQSRTLPGPIVTQLVSVEDIARSRHSQLEAIESYERGETTKGREIIRVVEGEVGEPEVGGMHKLLLQDANGVGVYAVEMESLDGVGLSMQLGSKILLNDVMVARAVCLLEKRNVTLLGGKVDEWQRQSKERRKEALKKGLDEVTASAGGE